MYAPPSTLALWLNALRDFVPIVIDAMDWEHLALLLESGRLVAWDDCGVVGGALISGPARCSPSFGGALEKAGHGRVWR